MGGKWKQWWTLFSWAPKSLWMVTGAMKQTLAPWKKNYDKPRQHIKKQRHHSANNGPSNQAIVFPIFVYRCENWIIKPEWWRTDAFELWCWIRLLSVPWTTRRSNQSILKEINPDCSLKGLLMKMKLQYLIWLPNAKSWLTGKDPDAEKDWWQKEKRAAEDEMAGWHHQLNGHEFEQTLGDSEGQGRLACCSPWGHKELDTT